MKKAVLLTTMAVLTLTWTQSGYTDGACSVQRGIDPLDVLNQTVRHNVWVILDTSGSMGGSFGGSKNKDKLDAARETLIDLMTNVLVDASGAPLVNWGYVNFNLNPPNPSYRDQACNNQFSGNQCTGIDNSSWVNPPVCGGKDTRPTIEQKLNEARHTGYTPNGISLDQVSDRIVNDPNTTPSALLEGQRNFIIIMTDGRDTCECKDDVWSPTPISEGFPSSDVVPQKLRGSDKNWNYTTNANNSAGRQAVNAGTKARLAYARFNPTTQDRATAEKGNIFVIGMGLGSSDKERTNHLAWEASGAFYSSSEATPALFANNQEDLKNRLLDVFAKIGVPETEVSLGTPVVGSVKELIPEIPGLLIDDNGTVRSVGPDDVLGEMSPPDLQDVTEARRLRTILSNNVLFTTSVTLPGFKGHLKAYNAYRVKDFETGQGVRIFDDRPDDEKLFWDAGEMLQNRDPDDRTILFNLQDDPPGTPPVEFQIPEKGGTLSYGELADILDVDTGYLSEIDGEGVSCQEDAVRAVVQVLRGYRLVVSSTTGIYKDAGRTCGNLNFSTTDASGGPTWKLLDPTNVGPTVVQNPPRSADADPPINDADAFGFGTFPDGFYWEHLNRQTVVYLPTNDGMLHAFRADNGAELFAYIPGDAMGNWKTGEKKGSRDTLKNLVSLLVSDNNGIANHKFLLSGSASVEDVFLRSPEGDDAWHTALAFGRGKGGKFLTALDVSDIPDWDGNLNNVDDRLDPSNPSELPSLLFTVGNREGVTDKDANGETYDGLGETWSIPLIGNVHADSDPDQWVLFVGAGYGCKDSDEKEGQYLYVLKMEDGSIYERFQVSNDKNAPIAYNGLVATPVLYNPHQFLFEDEEDYTTRVYISDLQGKVYKLDCSQPDPNNWALYEFYDLGNDQPITAQATLYRDNLDVYIALGTGGDARVDSTFQFATLVDQSDSKQGNLVWSLDLPDQERVYVAPVGIGGHDPSKPFGDPNETAPVVFFASSKSELDITTCTTEFSGTVFGLGLFTGLGVFDLDPSQTGDQESVSTVGKTTGMYARDGFVYVSQSGGIDAEGKTLVMGEKDWEAALDSASPSAAGTVQMFVRGFRMSPF